MAHTDSMFLFEITVENVISTVNCRDFYIRSQFADVFNLILEKPNNLGSDLRKKPKKNKKKLRCDRNEQLKIQGKQSILFAMNVEALLSNMAKYPMEVSLWSKIQPDYLIASTHIPWSPVYIDYLSKLRRKPNPAPVNFTSEYNIFDEYTSRRMAVIKLATKLTYLKDKITTDFQSLSENKSQPIVYRGIHSERDTILRPNETPANSVENIGTIKTVYRNRKEKALIYNKVKRKYKQTVNSQLENKCEKTYSDQDTNIESHNRIEEINACYKKLSFKCLKSDTEIPKSKQLNLLKSKSCSSLNRDRFNISDYIFGDFTGPYGNQVYCVSYFTVENNSNKPSVSSKSSSRVNVSEKSEDSKGNYKMKLCHSECSSKKELGEVDCQNIFSLDLPEEASHLIRIRKCEQIDCDNRMEREPTNQPDERILIDLDQQKCCDVTKHTEIISGVKGKMKFDGEQCFCTCECTFGFTKKTTYCEICGGYEKFGEELAKVSAINLPYPCPIYHKLVDKNKLKTRSTSGSEIRKRTEDSQKNLKGTKLFHSDKQSAADKSIDSEKDSKKSKKKKKDDRFKFNYGYQGIRTYFYYENIP